MPAKDTLGTHGAICPRRKPASARFWQTCCASASGSWAWHLCAKVVEYEGPSCSLMPQEPFLALQRRQHELWRTFLGQFQSASKRAMTAKTPKEEQRPLICLRAILYPPSSGVTYVILNSGRIEGNRSDSPVRWRVVRVIKAHGSLTLTRKQPCTTQGLMAHSRASPGPFPETKTTHTIS